ncbi:MAG: rhomboid family intramembrane serine protease [Nanoarchaeota archaeon]
MKSKFSVLWLCFVCIVIFIIQAFSPSFTQLFLLTDQANNGEVWRFVTAIFLHGSITHLFYNLFALFLFGFMLEKIVGTKYFLQIFFVSGTIANLVAVNYYESSLGASGAIYGVIGALTLIRPFIPVFAFSLPMPLILASSLWVIGDILRSLGAFGPTTIGSIAHISGIIVGIILALIIQKKSLKEKSFTHKIDEKLMHQWENDFMKRI